MPQNEPSPTTRWWEPTGWLRLIQSVWFDQAWYWSNVWPFLKYRPQRWRFNVQAILGTVPSMLVLSGVVGGLLMLVGIPVNWIRMFLDMTLGVIFGQLAITGFSELGNPLESVADNVIFGPIFGIIAVFNTMRGLPTSSGWDIGIRLGFGLLIGIGYGMHQGVARGMKWNLENKTGEIIFISAFFGLLVSLILGNISSALFTALTAVLGIHFSNRWATRELPERTEDEE